VIDVAAGDPAEQFRTIDAELSAYGAGLEERPQIVVLNKVDLEPSPVFDVEDERVLEVLRVSAATGAGIDELKSVLFRLVPPAPEPAADEPGVADFLVYRPEPRRRAFRIFRTDRGYRVVGSPPSGDELEAALRAAGVKAGDEVVVGDDVLEFR
jgi:predicted GTPase